MANDFIFELGCEELPSAAVLLLAEELTKELLSGLDKLQLQYGEVRHYATPRRIAVTIANLQAEQESQTIVKRGPAVKAAFDADNKPTPALLGFAKSCDVEIAQLKRINTEKGEWMVYESETAGKPIKEIMPALLHEALAALPITKPMRWGRGDDAFARPVHWALLMYANEVLPCQILGVMTGNTTRGHRFHHPDAIIIESTQSYEEQLKKAKVIADFAARRRIIVEQVEALATQYQATAVMPDALLDEVTAIVEWPQALIAQFEPAFLEVPAEALIASMQSHQKCFALRDPSGVLLPYFITVANIHSTNPQQVIHGNEKVMRARLSDAAFFFNQDKKQALSQHIAATKQVIFQTKLGSLYDKAERIKHLMAYVTPLLSLPLSQAERVAQLSKCDLLTGMVGEFPDLQGLMGYYYALHDGEDKAVAHALNEQYMPRFAADNLPESPLGLALSLADRIDTLVGIFAIGQKPSGVKDPFKLRRHALAVARLLLTTPAKINLSELIHKAATIFPDTIAIQASDLDELKIFILERLNSYYQGQGVSLPLLQAVRNKQDEWLYDLDKRLQALTHFITLPEAASLAAACKRVNNLLSQTMDAQLAYVVDDSLLEDKAEKALYDSILQMKQGQERLYQQGDYAQLLKLLATLKEPIDVFFEQVMVMTDNNELRSNRLALLSLLQEVLQGVADISTLS